MGDAPVLKADLRDSGQVVWLARHGIRLDFVAPTWRENAPRPYDSPLAPVGIAQAKELGQHLRVHGRGIRQIFASPFWRTVETAYYVAEALDLSINIEPGAGEWINPEWFETIPECLSPQELSAEFPRINLDYRPLLPPAGMETVADIGTRTTIAIRQITHTYPEDIFIIGHGASVIGMAVGLVPRVANKVPQAALARIVKRGSTWLLEQDFSTAHLTE